MKLIIKGRYIEISEYFEMISESPLINNFESQLVDYSNTIEVLYLGAIADVIDVSYLRKSNDPYFFVDGFLQIENELMSVRILILGYNFEKNTVKLAVSQKIGKIGTTDSRKLKLTELRHKLKLGGLIVPDEYVDEVVLSGKSIDKTPDNELYIAEDSVLADSQNYPHAVTPDNYCLLIDSDKLVDFLDERYGIEIVDCPTFNLFSNGNKHHAGDVIVAEVDYTAYLNHAHTKITSDLALQYPSGIDPFCKLTAGENVKIKFTNKIGDDYSRFLTLKVEQKDRLGTPIDWSKVELSFAGIDLVLDSSDTYSAEFKISDKNSIGEITIDKDDDVIFFILESWDIYDEEHDVQVEYRADLKFYIEIEDNKEFCTKYNTRQLFQNLPDITVFEFLKEVAKATAKYLKVEDNTITFVDIADILDYSQLIDATDYFLRAGNVEYSLYDSGQLEYWYKGAETPTLIVPISDERVKNPAKKVDIGILRTDDENVMLFKEDGKTPLEGIATYPFLDITKKATELTNFYLSIQKPFVINATFRNFKFDMSNAILIKQLNGIFIPKKIIRTNKEIIELELLKLED